MSISPDATNGSTKRQPQSTARQNQDSRVSESFLYVVECGEFVKVGFARDPKARLGHLRTGNPHELALRYSVPVPHAQRKLYERSVHRELKAHRHRDEWFRATWQEAEAAIERVHEMAAERKAWLKRARETPVPVWVPPPEPEPEPHRYVSPPGDDKGLPLYSPFRE